MRCGLTLRVLASLAILLLAVSCSKKGHKGGVGSGASDQSSSQSEQTQGAKEGDTSRVAATGTTVGVSGGGASGGPEAGRPVEGAKEIKKIVEVEKPAAPDCFTISFRHKKAAGHANEEDCSRHKNVLRLPHANVNKSALCVRVNGRPVPYQPVKGKPQDIMIGSLAGPQAVITARYCLGKVKCAEECKVPRDEFMDAIGGSADESEHAGKWDSSDGSARDKAAAKVDEEIKKEMAEFEDGVDIFSDWISSEGSTELACKAGDKQQIAGRKSK